MNDGRPAPSGCTARGIGGALTSTRGSANAVRSPVTEAARRDNATPAAPVSPPAATKPSATNESRRPRSTPVLAVSPASVKRPDSRKCSAATPHAVPTTVGITSGAPAPARDSTAADPTIPAATITTLPTGNRRVCRAALTAASAAITPSTASVSTSLSAIPNVVIAHSLTAPGVASMTADPTAVRASACGPNGTAANSVTPTATAAAATPHQARVLCGRPAMDANVVSRAPERLTER